ncbi:MAG: translation initiation factor IF-2 subunit beta [Candidatus Micrarchaeota archaeon]|nr:translation initiation factor IF-2 subunit beta [Candidatus Micrarchaeota archaeon]
MEYDKMLERAYEKMPKKTGSGERFEIPVADSFIQGSKTMVKNFGAICETLRRDPQDVAKYMYRELAIPGNVEGGRLVLHGKFSARILNERIKNFTESFVICKECRKPDTKLSEGGRGVKTLVCEACGAKSPVRMH